MIRRNKKKLFFAIAFTATLLHVSCKVTFSMEANGSSSQKKVVIFDVGGVLATTNKLAALGTLGKIAVASYLARDWKTPDSLRSATYDCLDILGEEKNDSIRDPYGDCVPTLFCDVLRGTIAEQTAHRFAHNVIEGHDEFCSDRQKNLCKTMAGIMFHPPTLVSTQQEVLEGTRLLADCKKAGHRVLIFSNYAPEAFTLLKEKLPHVFGTIPDDHIIVSGHIGAAKPEPAAYEALKDRLAQLGINSTPETCFFIDDQVENIEEAGNHDITGIHCANSNFAAVRTRLKEHGVLQPIS